MIKKEFYISGFDCPNCAAKAENFIATQKNVEYVHLDFTANRLYITFKDNPWGVEELRNVVKQVESDELEINEIASDLNVTKNQIFTTKMKILLIRIIIAVTLSLVCMFALAKADLSWWRFSLYCLAIMIVGYDIFYKVIVHVKNRNNVLDHNLLIMVASFGSLALAIIELVKGNPSEAIHGFVALDDSIEGVMVIVLFQIGVIIENIATNKSKNAISSAIGLRVDTANLITENGIKTVKPEELKINDRIIVTTGELIPIDGTIIEGEGLIDTSSLTGEFIPIRGEVNTEVFGGCLLKEGSITVCVNKEYSDSTVSKILKLIESGGEKKSQADVFIAKFAKFYTPIVVILSILVLLIGGLVSFSMGNPNGWMIWVHTGLEILVIGCPCAIVISVPLAYFSGLGLASKHGIVVKGGNYLDELAKLGKLVTDKTGTLTHGSFTIKSMHPIDGNSDELMKYLLLVESLSNHPIAKAICHGQPNIKSQQVKNFVEIVGLGCEGDYQGKHIIAGDLRLMKKRNIKVDLCNEVGSVVYCAVNNKYIGCVVLADTLKDDAQPMVDLLHSKDVEIILLTGDHEDNAKEICNKLGIDRWHSELLPEDKSKYLEAEMKDYTKSVAFVGDGINDAPCIIRSDIGIAMGGIGSDIAVENADVIIMNDDPAKVYDAMKIAQKARKTSLFNIIFALFVKISVFVIALIFPEASFMMYVAIFADTGLTVLLVLNSLLLLYRPLKRKVR